MECATLNRQQAEQLTEFLPRDIGEKILSDDACVTSVLEEGIVISLGIFSFDEFSDDNVECLYLYTMPDKRKKGYASMLLSYSEEIFKKQGVRHMCFNLTALSENMDIWKQFLTGQGYRLLDMDWHILEYDFAAVENCPAIRNCSGTELSFQSLDRRQISYMIHEDKTIPRVIREIIRTEADCQKSLFYSVLGHLAAGVMIRDNGVDDLSVHALYLSTQLKNRGILLVMLARTIQVMREARSTDAKMYFYVEYQKQMQAYRKLFGVPKFDYQVCRLEKVLL